MCVIGCMLLVGSLVLAGVATVVCFCDLGCCSCLFGLCGVLGWLGLFVLVNVVLLGLGVGLVCCTTWSGFGVYCSAEGCVWVAFAVCWCLMLLIMVWVYLLSVFCRGVGFGMIVHV